MVKNRAMDRPKTTCSIRQGRRRPGSTIYGEVKLTEDYRELATAFLRAFDEGADVFALVTDDVQVMYPKWGIANGKAGLADLYRDLGPYLDGICHHPETFRYLVDGNEVCISGVSSGTLKDGRTWGPDGGYSGQFCTWFTFDGALASRIWIYIDPDYVGGTNAYYPWHQ